MLRKRKYIKEVFYLEAFCGVAVLGLGEPGVEGVVLFFGLEESFKGGELTLLPKELLLTLNVPLVEALEAIVGVVPLGLCFGLLGVVLLLLSCETTVLVEIGSILGEDSVGDGGGSCAGMGDFSKEEERSFMSRPIAITP